MNPIGASILFIVSLLVFTAPRRWALVSVMAGILFLTQGQQINVLGFNLYALRLIELVGFFRIARRNEFVFSKLNQIDKALVALYCYTTFVFVVRSSDGIAYQIGSTVDAFLCYFMFRGLLKNSDEFKWFLKALLLLLVPYASLLLVETFAHHNVFSSMGGIDFGGWTREGRPRCQGSFRHPSLLGTLGASFLPLYIGLLFSKPNRSFAGIGIGVCTLIVWASNSGGPAGCVGVAVIGWLLWRFRMHMKFFRRGTAIALILLALVMKAPIWYLIARVSSLTGGGGYHRSFLIDAAYHSLSQWWLFGMDVKETQHWFPYTLVTTGAADITNVFIAVGLTAGIVGILLLIRLLVSAYRSLGSALSLVRLNSRDIDSTEYLLWGLGVMLAVHIFNWLGITYFDQTYAIWFLQLAAISALAEITIIEPSSMVKESSIFHETPA